MALWLSDTSRESPWFGGTDDREPLTIRWWRDMVYPNGVHAHVGSPSHGGGCQASPPDGKLARVMRGGPHPLDRFSSQLR